MKRLRPPKPCRSSAGSGPEHGSLRRRRGGLLAGEAGGLRNVVRQELVARQLDEQIAGRFPCRAAAAGARRRDGPGHAGAAWLARAGHKRDRRRAGSEMVAAAGRCARRGAGGRAGARPDRAGQRHGDRRPLPAGQFRRRALSRRVLMAVEDPDALLAGLARMLAPGGLLALLVRNADALAMRPGLGGDWVTALGAFDSSKYHRPARLDVRADRLDTLTATLAGIGAPLHAWYGVRVFTDQRGRRCGDFPSAVSCRRCSRRRSGRGAAIRTDGWPRCCTCAACGARARPRSTAGGPRRGPARVRCSADRRGRGRRTA